MKIQQQNKNKVNNIEGYFKWEEDTLKISYDIEGDGELM